MCPQVRRGPVKSHRLASTTVGGAQCAQTLLGRGARQQPSLAAPHFASRPLTLPHGFRGPANPPGVTPH